MRRTVLLVLAGGILIMAALVATGAWAGSSKPAPRALSRVERPAATPVYQLQYHVAGSAMSPSINDGDMLAVNTDARSFTPGQIVIFRYPNDPATVYCRRVVGVAGDRVVMKYYSNVKITTMYDSYRPQGISLPTNVNPIGSSYDTSDTTVGDNSLYVVGDNSAPDASYDSDEWGLLPVSDVIGVVVGRISPNARQF